MKARQPVIRPMPDLKAILFDMDGTLTVPWIDWSRLRAAVGVADGRGIIEHIDTLAPAARHRAEGIVRRFEMAAARQAPANTGLRELFARLDRMPYRRALITNSHRAAMDHVRQRYGLSFDLCLCREDGVLKPAPDLLRMALAYFGIDAAEAVFVGDGRYDRVASAAAGVRYIHLAHDRRHHGKEETIYQLPELLDLLAPSP